MCSLDPLKGERDVGRRWETLKTLLEQHGVQVHKEWIECGTLMMLINWLYDIIVDMLAPK